MSMSPVNLPSMITVQLGFSKVKEVKNLYCLSRNTQYTNGLLYFYFLFRCKQLSGHFNDTEKMREKNTTCLHLQKTEDRKETGEPTQRKLRQPDTWWSWVVCAAGVTCNIIVIGCTYCFGIIFPSLLDEFKAGKSKTGK